MKNLNRLADILTSDTDLSYNPEGKKEFGSVGKRAMKELAQHLKMKEYKASFNPSGIAVSGDLGLMGMFDDNIGVYITMNKDMGRNSQILYRTIKDMKGYSGGSNNRMSFEELRNPDQLREKIYALVGKSGETAQLERAKIEMKPTAEGLPLKSRAEIPDFIRNNKLEFFTDGAHGWIRVPLALIKKLKIKDKISGSSLLDSQFAYLEEDLDLGVFFTAIGIGWSPDESDRTKDLRQYFWDTIGTTDTSTSSRTIFIRELNHFDAKKFEDGGGLDTETAEKMKSMSQGHFDKVWEAIKSHPEGVKVDSEDYEEFHKKVANPYYLTGNSKEELPENPHLHLYKTTDGYYEAFNQSKKEGYYVPYDMSSYEKLKRIDIKKPNYFKEIGGDKTRIKFEQGLLGGSNILGWVKSQDTPESKALNGVSEDIERQKFVLRSVKIADLLKTDKQLAGVIEKGLPAKKAPLDRTPIVVGNDIEGDKKRKGIVLYGYDQVAQYLSQGRETIPAVVSVVDISMAEGGDVNLDGISKKRLEKLKEAGFTDTEIAIFWNGWSKVLPVKADIEGTTGLSNFRDESVEGTIDQTISNSKDGYYEAGLKHLSFVPESDLDEVGGFSKLLKKIGFGEPFEFNKKRKDISTGKEVTDTFEIYPYKTGNSFLSVSKGNYQGLISKSKKELFDISKKILGNKDVYVKDFEYLQNGLGAIGLSDNVHKDIFDRIDGKPAPTPPDGGKDKKLKLAQAKAKAQKQKIEILKMSSGKKAEPTGAESYKISYLNKDDKFKKTEKSFKGENAYEDAIKWGKENLGNFHSDMVQKQYAEGGSMATGGGVEKPIWLATMLTSDGKLLAERFDYPITHEQLYAKYKAEGKEISDAQINQINNPNILDTFKKAIDVLVKEKYSDQVDWANTYLTYSSKDNQAVLTSAPVKTVGGKEYIITPAELVNMKFSEGGDIEKGHRKLYVQTGNGRIPVTILNKLSKELYGIPNWYTLNGQDGNAGQTVVMEALNRKGTEGYKFSEGGGISIPVALAMMPSTTAMAKGGETNVFDLNNFVARWDAGNGETFINQFIDVNGNSIDYPEDSDDKKISDMASSLYYDAKNYEYQDGKRYGSAIYRDGEQVYFGLIDGEPAHAYEYKMEIFKKAKEKKGSMEKGGEALAEGIEIEKEHKELYDRIKKRLDAEGVEMPISEHEFYKTIAEDHLKEDQHYYDLLKKYVEKMEKGGTLKFGDTVHDSKANKTGMVYEVSNSLVTIRTIDGIHTFERKYAEKIKEDFKAGGSMYEGGDVSFNYRLLDRLRSDCDYFLGAGGGSEKHLWAGNVDSQISEMKRLWNIFPEDKKPEWLSMEDILTYEAKMKNKSSMAIGGSLEPRFTEYKGKEIMYEPHLKGYFTNDREFSSLEEAKKYIDDGSPMSAKQKSLYRYGAMSEGGGVHDDLHKQGWIPANQLEKELSSKYPIGDSVEADTKYGKVEGKIIGYTLVDGDFGSTYKRAVRVDGMRKGRNGEYAVSIYDIKKIGSTYQGGGEIPESYRPTANNTSTATIGKNNYIVYKPFPDQGVDRTFYSLMTDSEWDDYYNNQDKQGIRYRLMSKAVPRENIKEQFPKIDDHSIVEAGGYWDR